MIWMIKNIKDGRVVFKHKEFDRYYVSDFSTISQDMSLYTTEDIKEAYEVLEAVKYHWAGINMNYWEVVETYG